MRVSPILAFAFAAAVVAAPGKDEKPALVRALDVKIEGRSMGKVTEPTVITSADELEKAVKDEAAAKVIAKAVDFKKEKVLYFQWAGSGQDKLTFEVGEAEISFNHKVGLTRDLRQHKAVFAVAKDAKFKVVSSR